jgi:hypothetical protein
LSNPAAKPAQVADYPKREKKEQIQSFQKSDQVDAAYHSVPQDLMHDCSSTVWWIATKQPAILKRMSAGFDGIEPKTATRRNSLNAKPAVEALDICADSVGAGPGVHGTIAIDAAAWATNFSAL